MAQKFLNGIDVSSTTVINGNNLSSDSTVLDVQGSQGQLFSVTNSLTGDLFSVSDISGIPILNVNSSGAITFDGYIPDNNKLKFGDSGDLQIYHDGSHSYVKDTGTGNLTLSGTNLYLTTNNGQILFKGITDAETGLYYDNSLKLETTSTGVTVTGGWVTSGVSVAQANVEHTDNTKALFGNGNDLEIYHDGSNSYIQDTGTGNLIITASSSLQLKSAGDEFYMIGNADGQVALYNNGIKKFETSSGGVEVLGNLGLSSATGPIITLTDTDDSIGVDSIIGHIAFVGTEIGSETSRIASVSETAGGEAGLRFYTGASVTQALQLDKDQNATFAGDVLVEDNLYLTDAGTVRGKIQLNASDRDNLDIKAVSLGSLMRFYTVDTLALTLDDSQDATFAGDVTVGGDLIVNGTTTTLNTTTVEVEDNILQLNTTQGSPDTATAATSGISVYRGDGVTQASLIFDDSDDTWDLTNNLKVAGNVDIYTGTGLATLNIGRNTQEKLQIDQTDNETVLTAYNDSDGDSTHSFRLNRVFQGSGANNFIIQKNGTGQLTLDKDANATFAGTVTVNGSGGITVSDGSWNGLTITGSGTSHTQGAIVLKSSTTDTPEARGQGVFMFNEGDDVTWYMGTRYQDADEWQLGRKTGTSIDTEAAETGNALIKVNSAGNATFEGTITSGPTFINGNTDNSVEFLTIDDADPTTGSQRPHIKFTGASSQLGKIRVLDNGVGMQFLNSSDDEKLTISDAGNATFEGDIFVEKNTPKITLGKINDTTGNAKIQFYSKNNSVANGYLIEYNKNTGVDRLDFIDGSGNANIKFDNGGHAHFTAATVSGDLTVNGNTQLGNALTDKVVIHGHLGIGHETYPKIAYPGQNALWGEANSSTTGQVVIDLPGTLSNYDMMYMEIDIYEYNSTNATKLIIGAHNWNSGGNSGTGNLMWYNVGVTVIGGLDKPVYLGWRNDGTSNRRVIAIGETNSTWSYPTIHVSKVHGNDGYNTGIDWVGDWAMNLTTSNSFFTKSPTTNWNSSSATTFRTPGKGVFGGSVTSTTLVPSSHIYLGTNKRLYLDGGGNTYIRESSADTVQIVTGDTITAEFAGTALTLRNTTFNGNITASADSTHDIGSNGTRFANGYFDTLYGDGSNLTGVTSSNADTVDSLHASSFLRSDQDDSGTGTITLADSSAADNPLILGSSSQTNYTLQQFQTSSHGTNNAYIIAYGAGHGSEAGNFAIKNTLSGKNIFFEVDGVVPLRLGNGSSTVTGDLSVTGDLNITGDINSVSVTNLDVDDKTITIAKGAADSAAADGAGIVVDGASASILYDHTGTQWEVNKPFEVKVGSSSITMSEYSNGAVIWLDGSDGDMIGSDYYNIAAYGGGSGSKLSFGYGAGEKMYMDMAGNLLTHGTIDVTGTGASTFAGNLKIKNALIDNASVTSATTTTTVASISGTTYAAVFFDYVIYKSSNIRAGTVVACSDGTNVSFTETSTTDLGDTSDVTLAVDYSSANFRLRATTTSSTWNIKAIIRAI